MVLYEWEALVKNFNAHKYTVTDCTDKEFIGINITHDEEYNYYMNQTRMITEIIKETNLTGAKDERLPYPLGNAALSKLDSATEEQKKEIPISQSRRTAHVWHGTHHDRNHVRAQRPLKIRKQPRTKTYRVSKTFA